MFEKTAKCAAKQQQPRALLSLATGTGKTFIAANLLKRIDDAGQLKRALFLCDRDELRTEGLKEMTSYFKADAAEVFEDAEGNNNAENARVHVGTYQTLGIDSDGGVFSAAGAAVKTNLLFFTKGQSTEKIWYYDLSDVKVGKRRR